MIGRVLVVGPHDLVTTSVVAALRTHGFVAEEWAAGNGVPAAPDPGGVAVVALPVPAGLVAAAVGAGWRVLALGGPDDVGATASAVAEGAAAALPRSAPLDRLLDVLARLATGDAAMAAEEQRAYVALHRSAQRREAARRRQLDALTDREFEVLRRLERGQRAADIAQEVVVAMSTVRTHIRSILHKLDVHSQHQAVEVYRQVRRQGG